jgi:NAD(P)-dependent dehydrogenase (short-subunit alcohol dehydrogenase family)
MAGQFSDKVALITGGSSGIGRASAIAFAGEGAKVVVADVDVEGGQGTVKLIKSAGGEAIFVKTDMTSSRDIEALVNAAVKTYGSLDYAHNNAGVGASGAKTADVTEEDWNRVININLKGVWLCMKYELQQMLKQGKGAIVNTASIYGITTQSNAPEYTASKHGVVGLTKAAAMDYAQNNIRVNAICPGAIYTPMLAQAFSYGPEWEKAILASEAMGRVGKPEEAAAAVIWLCSDGASFVTGHSMPVDGGWLAGMILHPEQYKS